MKLFKRYAIFYTPHQSDLALFGAQWLGWDSAASTTAKHPALSQSDGTPFDVASLTRTPRKYGLHGTLKAPFHLAIGMTLPDLKEAADSFAKTHAPVTMDGVSLQFLRGFLALRPTGDQSALSALAADITRDFDRFRAPLSEADIARRRKADLNARQDQQMLDWGYPFIFDDFHFHLTLSGKIEQSYGEAVKDALTPQLSPILTRPFRIDGITVMGEDADGLFHQIHRASLSEETRG
jgi:putative phosphonate metabolism protein